jgi:DNA-damage-inducible protein J
LICTKPPPIIKEEAAMADTVNITIRLDRKLKSNAESMFEDIGMNLSTAVNIFLRQTVRQGQIPFKIEADTFWSERNQARLEESRREAETGHLTEHELIETG